jgi:hypothetical protein
VSILGFFKRLFRRRELSYEDGVKIIDEVFEKELRRIEKSPIGSGPHAAEQQQSIGFRGTLRMCSKHTVVALHIGFGRFIFAGDSSKCRESCIYEPVSESKVLEVFEWSEDRLLNAVYNLLTSINLASLPEIARQIRKDCEDRLGLAVEQERELSHFSQVSQISSALEATDILFDKAILATPKVSPQKARALYESVKRSWGSQTLIEGSREEIKSVVLRNLQRLEKRSDFRYHSVDVYLDHECAQISTSFERKPRWTFIGIRVWRSQNRFFACGDENFR